MKIGLKVIQRIKEKLNLQIKSSNLRPHDFFP